MATYRKKMMEPIITKFRINPETNTDFQQIVDLFGDQPNYQEWAVKMYFTKSASMTMLAAIKDFTVRFSSQIKSLSEQNIVAYSSKAKIQSLLKEMNGIALISFLKEEFAKFNTEQKNMLNRKFLDPMPTPLQASTSGEIKAVVAMFKKIDELPSSRRKNFWTNCSALKNIDSLVAAIRDAPSNDYLWEKEDFLYFMKNNKDVSGCEVIVDNGNVVVVKVDSWPASKILGGGGRTQWCICTQEHFFQEYVTNHKNPKHEQFMLFDFSKAEYEELAHIAFTVKSGYGICNAFSCRDNDILGSTIEYKGERYNIGKALAAASVELGSFMSVKDAKYEWSVQSLLEFVKNNTAMFEVRCEKNNVVAINVLSKNGLTELVGHTFMKLDKINMAQNTKVYTVFNFNVKQTSSLSICLGVYNVDPYGTYSETYGCDVFGTEVKVEEAVNEMGIEVNDFLASEKIDPNVLLHKYIDTNDEKKALQHLEEHKDEIDVNFMFNGRPPVFSAIANKQFELFTKLIHSKGYNMKDVDGFGETILEALVFQLGMVEVDSSNETERDFLVKCIDDILNSDFDFNSVDLNEDTIINICCEDESLSWIVEKLVQKPEVDVNRRNFFKVSPLASAIVNKNMKAIAHLMTRPDIEVTKEDIDVAREEGIDVNLLKPAKAASVSK